MEDLSNLAVALIALASNVAGFFTSNKLLNYRITQLEDTVKDRSKAVDAIHNLEKDIEYIKEQIKGNGG